MKLDKIVIAVLTSIAIFASSCGSDNNKAKDANEHTDGDGHNHTVVVENKAATKKVNL